MFARRGWLRAGVLIGLFALPSLSRGAILTFTMEGSINEVIDPAGLLTFAGVGDRAVYTFSFNSDAPDGSPSASRGTYSGISSGLQVKDVTFTGYAPEMLVQHPGDLFEVSSWANVNLPGMDPLGFAIFDLVDDVANNSLTDTLLPLEPLNLEPFHVRSFGLSFWPVGGGHDRPTLYLIGTVTSFTPEPASLAAMAVGLGLLTRPRRGFVR